ncbi:BLUF domain-containing protein [Blastomonas sp.]|uniref:BLUF domain-containing protein n=1 Tax=Blastomonas sp. TaxID=1909299 RepID=UPI003593D307
MALTSVLYISRSTIPAAEAERVVGRIVATAVACNPPVGLTGALLFTGTHFAQVLEGTADAIDDLLANIRKDPRHDQMLVVDRSALAERRFADWSMAYFGPSQFVARHVTRLLNDPSPAEQARAADWLTDLMREFTDPSHVH